ncbi:MAG: hydrogenase maturation protease [Desulfobacter sp.]|nr:hydrogenase maturation protease [Desulfobacter sp.]WDP86787.1 MAG: hydrogenase maturation protease [Desulfobacter sp.]
MTTQVYDRQYLVFGCGNTLFGNDGFGPEVVYEINATHTLPDSVLVLDAGTGIKDFVFDLLLVENPPKMVIVIDAVTVEGREQGEVFEIEISNVPSEKLADFSLHQAPSSNLLAQLAERGIDVQVIAMQTETIPNEISPGLCPKARKAVKEAAALTIRKLESRKAFDL